MCAYAGIPQENKSPLYIACAQGNTAIVNILIKHKDSQQQLRSIAIPSHPGPGTPGMGTGTAAGCVDPTVGYMDIWGQTALYITCLYNQLAVFKLLFKYEEFAEMINIPNINGETPLYVCCCYNYQELVKIILKIPNTKLNICNKVGRSECLSVCVTHVYCMIFVL